VCVARITQGGGRHDQGVGRRSRMVMVEHVPHIKRVGRRGGELPGLQVLHCTLWCAV
jgi:hypothetical protein